MLSVFFKAMLVGVCASAMIGPVAILVFQRTLCYGRREGFYTGIGSTIADTTFAAISLFTISAIQEFIAHNGGIIMLIGGSVIVLVGVMMALKNPVKNIAATDKDVSSVGGAAKALGCAFANPGALALMLALTAVFGLGQGDWMSIALAVLGVASGELTYWMCFTAVVNRVGEFFRPKTIRIICLAAGIGMAVFGIVLVTKGILAFVKI